MKVLDPKELRKESVVTDNEVFISKMRAFQASDYFDVVMSIVQEALDDSIVQELLNSKQGDADEKEVGRLTLVEWAARKKIEQKIKNKLTKNYE